MRTVFSNDSQFIVHIDVPDLALQLLPGMTADVAIEINRKENALVIPVAGIDHGKVNYLRGGFHHEAEIKTGIVDGDSAEVVSGEIAEGDQILMKKTK